MSGSNLLPEQEKLLCRLVEARNQHLPERAPFRYMKDYTGAADVAILMHPGWSEDWSPPHLVDLDALALDGYIHRKSLGKAWEFEIARKALDLYGSLHPREDDADDAEEVGSDGASVMASALGHRLDERPAFQKVGQKWVVRYEGETKYFNHTKGMTYLWILISHCGEQYEPLELLDAVEGIEPSRPSSRAPSHQFLKESGLTVSGLSDAGKVADRQAAREVWEALEAIREELERARDLNDIGRIEGLAEEEQHYRDYLFDAVRPGGQLRDAVSDYENVRSRVYMNLYRALETIREVHPHLYEHLHIAISRNPPYSYRPNHDIDWLF